MMDARYTVEVKRAMTRGIVLLVALVVGLAALSLATAPSSGAPGAAEAALGAPAPEAAPICDDCLEPGAYQACWEAEAGCAHCTSTCCDTGNDKCCCLHVDHCTCSDNPTM